MRTQNSPVEGDALMVDSSPELVLQMLPPETEAHTSLGQFTCSNCNRSFKRMQELRRHLLSNLPHPFRCPNPNCSWSCSRQERLDKHIKTHQNFDSGHEFENQLYDPEQLLDWMVDGIVDVVSAAEFALSLIKAKLEELDLAGVETKVWSSRRKFCTQRRRSIH